MRAYSLILIYRIDLGSIFEFNLRLLRLFSIIANSINFLNSQFSDNWILYEYSQSALADYPHLDASKIKICIESTDKIFQNLFLTTNHANGLSQATQRPLVSPVGRSPIPNQPCQTAPMQRGDVKNGKDKVNMTHMSICWPCASHLKLTNRIFFMILVKSIEDNWRYFSINEPFYSDQVINLFY